MTFLYWYVLKIYWMVITWWHMVTFLRDATLDPQIPEYLTHLPVSGNSTGVTLPFGLLIVFPLITSKQDGEAWVFQLNCLLSIKKANNPRILHVKEFISFLLQWHLTEWISPELKQMWWVGKGSCRGVPPGKSYWDQEAAVKTLKYSTLGELLGDSEEKGQKTKFCLFPVFTLTTLFAAHVMISCDKHKCLLRNYEF